MTDPVRDRAPTNSSLDRSLDEKAERLVDDIKARWSSGSVVDARKALQEHSELRGRKSLVLDLAYEEYCRRTEAGEAVNRKAFLDRFPTCQYSLARLLDVHAYLSRNGTTTGLAEVAWPEVGATILGFKILEELGRGAFARVYLASEVALGDRLVAIKFAPRGAKEAHTLGRLEHPYVVPIHAVLHEPESELTALVMPYLGARTLCDLLDESPRATLVKRRYVESVLRLGIKLCEALEFTHGKGILHRDLKPSNILLPGPDRPMLLDFNLASETNRVVDRAGGTLPYMSPEQLQGLLENGAVLDARSDLFGLGVVLFELLTGSLPFQPEDALSASAQRTSRGQSPKLLRARLLKVVDRGTADVLVRCLSAEPANRPQSAAELAGDLRRCLSPAKTARRWLTEHRRSALAAIVCLAMILGATGIWAWSRAPFEIRAYRDGIAQLQRGEPAAASASFSTSLGVARTPPVLIARGRAYAQLGDAEPSYFALAARDFSEAVLLSPQPRILALQGFCQGKLTSHTAAIDLYRQAIEKGFTSPELLNDLGYSLMQMSKLPESMKAFDQAVEANPKLQAPIFNRAKLNFRLAVREGRFPKEAIDDIRAALALGEHPEICRDRIRIYAFAAKTDSAYLPEMFEALKAGDELGLDLEKLLKDLVFDPVREHPEVQAVRSKGATKPFTPYPSIVDPLGPVERIAAE